MNIYFEQSNVVKVMQFLEQGILAHIVNDQGVMGAGIAEEIADTWNSVFHEYDSIVMDNEKKDLYGKVLFVNVKSELVVANMFAQRGLKSTNNPYPLDYDLLQECLNKLFDYAISNNMEIRLPRIGSGLAGGNWDKIWYMIISTAREKQFNGNLTLHQL